MLVFVIRFEYKRSFALTGDNYLVDFFTEFGSSVKEYDIIYLTLFVFILYFYNNVYFNGDKYNKKSIVITIVSLFMSIFTVMGKSYVIDGTL